MLLTSLDLNTENRGGMPFRVSRLQSMRLRAAQLDWHQDRNDTSSLASSLTSLHVHGLRIPYRMDSLQALLALRHLDFDFDLHMELDALSSLVRSLSAQLNV